MKRLILLGILLAVIVGCVGSESYKGDDPLVGTTFTIDVPTVYKKHDFVEVLESHRIEYKLQRAGTQRGFWADYDYPEIMYVPSGMKFTILERVLKHTPLETYDLYVIQDANGVKSAKSVVVIVGENINAQEVDEADLTNFYRPPTMAHQHFLHLEEEGSLNFVITLNPTDWGAEEKTILSEDSLERANQVADIQRKFEDKLPEQIINRITQKESLEPQITINADADTLAFLYGHDRSLRIDSVVVVE